MAAFQILDAYSNIIIVILDYEIIVMACIIIHLYILFLNQSNITSKDQSCSTQQEQDHHIQIMLGKN